MPLQERSIVSQRLEFCRLAQAPGANVSELCLRFGIGRTAAYDWLKQLDTKGRAVLAPPCPRHERSSRPVPTVRDPRLRVKLCGSPVRGTEGRFSAAGNKGDCGELVSGH